MKNAYTRYSPYVGFMRRAAFYFGTKSDDFVINPIDAMEIKTGLMIEMTGDSLYLQQNEANFISNYLEPNIAGFDGAMVVYDLSAKYSRGRSYDNGQRETNIRNVHFTAINDSTKPKIIQAKTKLDDVYHSNNINYVTVFKGDMGMIPVDPWSPPTSGEGADSTLIPVEYAAPIAITSRPASDDPAAPVSSAPSSAASSSSDVYIFFDFEDDFIYPDANTGGGTEPIGVPITTVFSDGNNTGSGTSIGNTGGSGGYPHGYQQDTGTGGGGFSNMNPEDKIVYMQQFDRHIDDTNVLPCIKNILDKIKGGTQGGIADIIDKFSGQLPIGWNWRVKMGTLNGSTNARTTVIVENGIIIVQTTLDTEEMKKATDLAIARTLIHEIIHAYLTKYYDDLTKAGIGEDLYPNISYKEQYDKRYAKWWIKFNEGKRKLSSEPKFDYNLYQHQIMDIHFIGVISDALKNYGRASGYVFSDAEEEKRFYYLLSWGGLNFNNKRGLSDADRVSIQNLLSAEDTGSTFGEYTAKGIQTCK